MDLVRSKGMALAADDILARWFGRKFLAGPDVAQWRDMLSNCSVEGYCGVCAAIAGTDFYTPTSGLRLPTLGFSGPEDRSTPPDLVRETLGLIPGSEFKLIRGTGHLPCVERPEEVAAELTAFLGRIGHLGPPD